MTSPTISEKEITVSTQARTVATTLREGAAIAKAKGQAVGLPPEDADKLGRTPRSPCDSSGRGLVVVVPHYDPNEPQWAGNCPCHGPEWPCAVCGEGPARFFHKGQFWLCEKHDFPSPYTKEAADAHRKILRAAGIKELWLS